MVMTQSAMNWKGAKVLVTGASGFKGSWLCATLARLGARVYGTTRPQVNPLSAYNVLDVRRQITEVSGEITDRQQVYDMLNSVEPDVVFHLAAKALVPVALRDPRRAFDVNIMGTVNIIEACRKLGVCGRLLICSTDHVFGSTAPADLSAGGFDEASRVSHGGPYDTSKAAMELLVRSYHFTYWDELPAIGITRCANVFGFGDVNQRRVLPLFVNSAVHRGIIPLRYRKNGRQFIHITDAIAGYIRAASSLDEGSPATKRGNTRPEDRIPFTPTYHFAIEAYDNTDEPFVRMEPLANLVGSLLGVTVDSTRSIDYAPNENKVQALNCTKTRSVLGWQPRKPLHAAIEELAEWYRQAEAENIGGLRRLIDRDLEQLVLSAQDAGSQAPGR